VVKTQDVCIFHISRCFFAKLYYHTICHPTLQMEICVQNCTLILFVILHFKWKSVVWSDKYFSIYFYLLDIIIFVIWHDVQ
jgi:hypothetical protein